jgi:hypothetical protein
MLCRSSNLKDLKRNPKVYYRVHWGLPGSWPEVRHFSQCSPSRPVCEIQVLILFCHQSLGSVGFSLVKIRKMPISVAARSKACVCGRSLCGISGSNPTGGMVISVLWVLCVCQVEDRSPVQRSPADCGMSECDVENSTMRRPRPPRGCRAIKTD